MWRLLCGLEDNATMDWERSLGEPLAGAFHDGSSTMKKAAKRGFKAFISGSLKLKAPQN